MFLPDDVEYGVVCDGPILPGDIFYHRGFEQVEHVVDENSNLRGCCVLRAGYVPPPPEPVDALQPGDVVELKSGSPQMTVSLVEDDVAVCTWSQMGDIRVADVRLVVLRKVN